LSYAATASAKRPISSADLVERGAEVVPRAGVVGADLDDLAVRGGRLLVLALLRAAPRERELRVRAPRVGGADGGGLRHRGREVVLVDGGERGVEVRAVVGRDRTRDERQRGDAGEDGQEPAHRTPSRSGEGDAPSSLSSAGAPRGVERALSDWESRALEATAGAIEPRQVPGTRSRAPGKAGPRRRWNLEPGTWNLLEAPVAP
jgi:hypothetical protein